MDFQTIKASGMFNNSQLHRIQTALKDGLDIEKYAKPEFSSDQMSEIFEGIKNGAEVDAYADPKFAWRQMREIRLGLEEGLEQISVYADPAFDWKQMQEIRKGFEEGLSKEQVSVYADPKFDNGQMTELRDGFAFGINASVYANPELPWYWMYEIRYSLMMKQEMTDVLKAMLEPFIKPITIQGASALDYAARLINDAVKDGTFSNEFSLEKLKELGEKFDGKEELYRILIEEEVLNPEFHDIIDKLDEESCSKAGELFQSTESCLKAGELFQSGHFSEEENNKISSFFTSLYKDIVFNNLVYVKPVATEFWEEEMEL